MPFSNLHSKTFTLVFIFLFSVVISGCSLIGVDKPAALQVSSIPEASIFLDGKHLGKTPFFSDQLKSGVHTLKITASEATYVQKIDLFPETLTVVNRELNDNFLAQSGEVLWLENGKNSVFINSTPDQAEVAINGNFKGKTPLFVNDLTPGEYKVTLTKIGYIEREFSIKTSSKYQLTANVTLASEIAKNVNNLQPQDKQNVSMLQILSTPQGFLRVRKEPSLDSPEIGQVNTGDNLEIIQETPDWVKISFEGKLGWVSAKYTKKL